jgi:hypothetical protein
MGWGQVIAAIIGLMGGSFLNRGSGTAAPLTADEVEMQSLMKQLLAGQLGEYNSGKPLREHIQSTADWLLPKRSRIKYAPGSGDGENYDTRPTPQSEPGRVTADATPDMPALPSPGRFQPTATATAPPPTGVDPGAMQHLAQYLAKYGVRG